MALVHRHFPHIRLMRSAWFIPGNQPSKLAKIRTVGHWPDIFVPDLEDSVPTAEKLNGLNSLYDFLNTEWRATVEQFGKHGGGSTDTSLPLSLKRAQGLIPAGLPLMMPRLNYTPQCIHREVEKLGQLADIVDGFVLGKVESPLWQLDEHLQSVEHQLVPDSAAGNSTSLLLLPSVETPRGIINLGNILGSMPRIVGVGFGHDDYTTAMYTPTTECTEFALNNIAVHCMANECFPLDSPFTQFKDMEGLEKAANYARGLGCKGKFAIHPGQIETLNRVFSMTKEQYDWALLAIEAFEAAEKEGKASTSVRGKMVDIPVYKRAKSIKEAFEFVQGIDAARSAFLQTLKA
eukprot:TRINITY_DN84911_c0_g1_i1.p1 TRINITY_DN84911_c0_g1~~TRINITY_DN84911_c0_g1_i1.p1  ORF type:complete len:357 (-),score=34.84 TRINITY_DN84911_c0_g1_i1:50-1093(-)